METKQLLDKQGSREFYDGRFRDGYNKPWTSRYEARIREIIVAAGLPEAGRALDYGCGNGASTGVLKTMLPGWEVSGCDISDVAIRNASERFPACRFFQIDDPALSASKFDLIFSHHVLEHVYDLEEAVRQISSLAGGSSAVLLMLPCGNPGSYEYKLADARKDGIDRSMGNRFFFEVPAGHLRRLTSDDLITRFHGFGFRLKQEYYSGQYWGGIDTITSLMLFEIPRLTNPFKGKDLKSRMLLLRCLIQLGSVGILRAPAILYDIAVEKHSLSPKYAIAETILSLPAKISRLYDEHIRVRAMNEWKQSRSSRNGSVMSLLLVR